MNAPSLPGAAVGAMAGPRLQPPVRHDVYWATHGCNKIGGHADPCRCSCGEALPAGVKAFGRDVA